MIPQFLMCLTLVAVIYASENSSCIIQNTFYYSNIFTTPTSNEEILFSEQFEYNHVDDDGIWSIIPVKNTSGEFFILNQKYLYIYASSDIVGNFITGKKRRVFAKTCKEENCHKDEGFKWTFQEPEKIYGYTDFFETIKSFDIKYVVDQMRILNVKYGEPLYAKPFAKNTYDLIWFINFFRLPKLYTAIEKLERSDSRGLEWVLYCNKI